MASKITNPLDKPSLTEEVREPLLDAQSLAACRRGDRAAQERLYECFRSRVYRLMVRRVGHQDATDAMQLTFLKVFDKIGQFEGQSRFETRLYRVAVNEALQFMRKGKRWNFQSLVHEPMSHHTPAEERDAHKELLGRALDFLDPELRTVFVLKEIEQLSYADIAAAMEIPEGRVGSRLNRARRELQKHLAGLGWEP